MTTSFFHQSASFNIAISSKPLQLQLFERLKIFTMVGGGGLDILQEKD